MDTFDMSHICTGRSLIRLVQPDLEDDPALWAEIWDQSRSDLLPYWIGGHPGSRDGYEQIRDLDLRIRAVPMQVSGNR